MFRWLLILLLSSTAAHAQTDPRYFNLPLNGQGEFEITNIVEVDKSLHQLNTNAIAWFHEWNRQEFSQIVLDLPSSNLTMMEGWIPMGTGRFFEDFGVYYMMTVQCREGSYKVVISNVRHVFGTGTDEQRNILLLIGDENIYYDSGQVKQANLRKREAVLKYFYEKLEEIEQAMRSNKYNIQGDW